MHYNDEGEIEYTRLRDYAFDYIDFHPANVNPKFIVCAHNKREAIRLSPLGKKSNEYPEYITRYRKYRWIISDISWHVPRVNLSKNKTPGIKFERPGLRKPSGRRA